jgi:hypothetical protein
MDSPPDPSFTGLEKIDWESTTSILAGCRPVFDALTGDLGLLSRLLDNLGGDEYLKAMCERYDFLDKLVLHDIAPAGVRIRLHLYRPGYFDRPHNHRWSFASHILRGRYLHRIFGRDHEFTEDTDPEALLAIHERVEEAGATYALHHTSVHTVQAEAGTISLLLRGPAAKERFLILDRRAGDSFWVYGTARESPEQRSSKRMTEADLVHAISRVRSLIAPQAAATGMMP